MLVPTLMQRTSTLAPNTWSNFWKFALLCTPGCLLWERSFCHWSLAESTMLIIRSVRKKVRSLDLVNRTVIKESMSMIQQPYNCCTDSASIYPGKEYNFKRLYLCIAKSTWSHQSHNKPLARKCTTTGPGDDLLLLTYWKVHRLRNSWPCSS